MNRGGCTAQSIIELSRTQDEEVGDGTTSVIILGEHHSLGNTVCIRQHGRITCVFQMTRR